MINDIYFTPEWCAVNEYIEEGIPQRYELITHRGTVVNSFVLRKIPTQVGGKQYYDISTPYGYGGPILVGAVTEEDRECVLREYQEEFSKFCMEHDIVSEFIRFHPIANNAIDFKSIYDVQKLRKTVGTDLSNSDDPVQDQFSKSCRKSIRRALNAGVTWKVIEHPTGIEDFLKVYYSTMDRDKADEFYYFPKEYFYKCLELFGNQIIMVQAVFDDKIIAAGFYITSGDIIHAHLSGTLQEYLHLSPAYVVKYATAVWGKEHGYRLIHYGGGTSNSPDNSLYQFKLKFTKNTVFDFYIGKKIWNREIYKRLSQGKNSLDGFFPAYRER